MFNGINPLNNRAKHCKCFKLCYGQSLLSLIKMSALLLAANRYPVMLFYQCLKSTFILSVKLSVFFFFSSYLNQVPNLLIHKYYKSNGAVFNTFFGGCRWSAGPAISLFANSVEQQNPRTASSLNSKLRTTNMDTKEF